jgi:hypothetical protein
MLDERNVKAIMCARGGYGVVRIIDHLNWIKFSSIQNGLLVLVMLPFCTATSILTVALLLFIQK